MLDLSTFATSELPAFAVWLQQSGDFAAANEVWQEHTQRLDDELRLVKKQIHDDAVRQWQVTS